jgi:2-amino-4-hydroxy-6-hydroxymethyldihydropteridine diphosphokinase
MPRVWVSIGSNVDRDRNIGGALVDLRRAFGSLVVSQVYESDAVGFAGDAFYNLVAGFDTDKDIAKLVACFRAIEVAHGRKRGGNKFAPRTLDLDLLTYGAQVVERDGLKLPRAEILDYSFVLGPLAEVAGSERHPVLGRRYRDLWREFDQASQPLRPVAVDLDSAREEGLGELRDQC